jgi:nitroreductase
MTAQPIDAVDLESVVKAARYAPNAGNRRLQPVITVTDQATIRLMRKIAPGMAPLPQAIVVICTDRDRAIDFDFRPEAVGLYIDVGTTAATLLLAAHSVGLAAGPVTSFSHAAAGRILNTRASLEPQLLVCLGHAGDRQPPPMGASVRG